MTRRPAPLQAAQAESQEHEAAHEKACGRFHQRIAEHIPATQNIDPRGCGAGEKKRREH